MEDDEGEAGNFNNSKVIIQSNMEEIKMPFHL
jgi:hypothetical protein